MKVNRSALLATLILFAALQIGCTATVTPPHGLEQPVSIYILDHGRHSSLLLPAETGWKRFAYGDWRWYAEGNTGIVQGAAALFWPTPAGLGRQQVGSSPDRTPALTVGYESIYEIQVEMSLVMALTERLEALHEREQARRLFNPDHGLHFTAHPERYWLFNQSNGKVVQWLRELGCEVNHKPILARWRIAEPRSEGAAR